MLRQQQWHDINAKVVVAALAVAAAMQWADGAGNSCIIYEL
jgi:hypothetical protein